MKNVLLLIALSFLFACGNQQTQKDNESKESNKLVVTSVNYPLYYFAQRIGGDLIQLEYPIPADVDPAYWVPEDNALDIYQSADIILANGADYAKWMNNVSLSSSKIVNTSKAMEESYIELKDVTTHSHGPEGEHEHTGYAFTTWLDFELAIAQAEAIKNVLVYKLPDEKKHLEENFISLKSDLIGLHEKMLEVAMGSGGQHFIGSHPVYQYLTSAYGIQIHSVHFEPDAMPSEKQWKEIPHLMGHYPIDIMLWEGDPLSEIKEELYKYKLKVAVFNPCGNIPIKGDFMDIMKMNISALQNSL